MLWPWLHLVVGVVLFVAIIGGLLAKVPQAKVWVMIARICYIILIISGALMFSYAWHEHPILTIVKIILAVGLIGLIEMAFAKKLKKQFSRVMFYGALILAVIVVIIGFIMTDGFPLFH
ncbi:DUF1516 family protein [Bombilactobacillus bombi]|uniref:DUF1516 family protein n=1 Tax=Bombilactobacillus bombi TaxID=1303590 RepID=UPI000E56C913|nr:DUF1516 family protein [Bombilactobacillus bombi]AXX64778.1 DUF1516 family protein [Bombilactobacillus bombi]MCO6542024.1 DUF1516 family protein [Lactobacillus sp.]